LRQPILYAEIMWRRQRVWALFLVVVGVVATAYFGLNPQMRAGNQQSNFMIFAAYVPAGLIFLGLLMYYRWRSYVQVTDQGLKVSNLLHSVVIDWELIRNARVQPLERHFQEAKRRVPPAARALAPQPALFLRLKADDEKLKEIRRKLGSQIVYQDTLAVPIRDPNAMSWEISGRLPERTASNLGGQRRRKRSR
jgi:hypothetical protein